MKLKFLALVLIFLSIGTQAQAIREAGNYKMLYVSVQDAPNGVELTLSDISISSCGKQPGAEIVKKDFSDSLSLLSLVGQMITMDCPVRILPDGRMEAFPRVSYLREAKIILDNASGSDYFRKSILVPANVTYSVKAL